MNPVGILLCIMACLVAGTRADDEPCTDFTSPVCLLYYIDLFTDLGLLEPTFNLIRDLDELMHLINVYINSIIVPTRASYSPESKDIPVYIVQDEKRNVSTNLETFPSVACQEPNFGVVETIVIVCGLPQKANIIRNATGMLIKALKKDKKGSKSNKKQRGKNQQIQTPNVVVVDAAEHCKNFSCIAQLDHEKIGKSLAGALTDLTKKCNVQSKSITLIGQQGGAHIAAEAGREYEHSNNQKIHCIYALDPTTEVNGLSPNDADIVEAIYTSKFGGYGMRERLGTIGFTPIGLNRNVLKDQNIIEVSMYATHYFADDVLSGNRL